MFDPQGALSRDAADLVIDVSGKAKVDFAAIVAAGETGTEPPVPQPETLDIAEIAGAAIDPDRQRRGRVVAHFALADRDAAADAGIDVVLDANTVAYAGSSVKDITSDVLKQVK